MGREGWDLDTIKEIVRPVRIRLGYLLWLAKGKPSGEFYFKKRLCLEVASQYHCSTFIETGTGWGIMLGAVRRYPRGGPHPSDRGAAGLRCRSGVGFMPPRCSCPAVQEVRADRSMLHRG